MHFVVKFYIKRKNTANNLMVFVTNRHAEMFMRKGTDVDSVPQNV